MAIYNKKNIHGQSFFEVIIAMALISIVLITLVGLASASISASVFSRNQTQAVRYTEQATEWLSAEKSASWTNFIVHSHTSSWCLDSLYWLRSGDCTDSDFISGTNFKRSVNFTTNADGSISADVTTVWVDSRGSHSAPTSIVYTSGSAVVGGVASPTPTPIPAPIALWKLDENSGVNAADSSGNGSTGTLTLSPTWTSGKYGSAVNFNGTNYVTMGNPAILGVSGSFSVEAWVYPNSLPPSDNTFASIVEKGYDGSNESYFLRLHRDGSGNQSVEFGSCCGTEDAVWSTNLSTGSWHHLVGTWDGSNWRIYHNGTLVKTTSGSKGPRSTTKMFSLGGADINGSLSRFLNGKIDNVKIYNYTLSQAQVTYAYQHQ